MAFKDFLSGTKNALVIAKYFLGLAIIVAVFFLVKAISPGLHLFKHDLTIDKTANVVTEIKKISEFTTTCFYEEFILKDEKYSYSETAVYRKVESGSAILNMLGMSREKDGIRIDSTRTAEIAIIAKGKVRAGYRLSELSSYDINISSDTISIRLNQPELFDVIVNPSDLEIFNSIGEWSDDEISLMVANAKQNLKKDALDAGILEKAEKAGKEKLELLFKSFGFNVVNIQ